MTLLPVNGLELEVEVPLLGVPGREADLTPGPARFTGVVGREPFIPQSSLMMEVMKVLRGVQSEQVDKP
jgi:hypothetical protein